MENNKIKIKKSVERFEKTKQKKKTSQLKVPLTGFFQSVTFVIQSVQFEDSVLNTFTGL